jgi:hypothetical protein
MFVTDLVLGHRIHTITANASKGNWEKVKKVLDMTTTQLNKVERSNIDEHTLDSIKEKLELSYMNILCGIEQFVCDEVLMAQQQLQAFVRGKELYKQRLNMSCCDSEDHVGILDVLPYDVRVTIANMTKLVILLNKMNVSVCFILLNKMNVYNYINICHLS